MTHFPIGLTPGNRASKCLFTWMHPKVRLKSHKTSLCDLDEYLNFLVDEVKWEPLLWYESTPPSGWGVIHFPGQTAAFFSFSLEMGLKVFGSAS